VHIRTEIEKIEKLLIGTAFGGVIADASRCLAVAMLQLYLATQLAKAASPHGQ
jgi:hypothetical protein